MIYSGVVSRPAIIGPRDRIEPGTTFASWVWVSNCPAFVAFPDGTTFASSVEVSDCPAFVAFPDGTTFASSVEVRNCPAFVGSRGCAFRGHPIVFGEQADERIRRIAAAVEAEPQRLKMSDWHCGTAHCLAGWGVHQEGAEGYALEHELGGTPQAGMVLLGLEAAGHFYSTEGEAEQRVRDWLRAKLAAGRLLDGVQHAGAPS